MSWIATLQLALRALNRNKARALLTALGVIIGVASVIAMVAVGEGARQRVASQLEGMGTNNLMLRPGTVTRGGVRTGTGTVTTLTAADAEAVAELPGVVAAAPVVQASAQAIYRGVNWGTSVRGVTPAFLQVRNWPIVAGEPITERHVAGAEHVCMLGRTVARELFGLADPLGETVLLQGLACRVIAVLDEKGASAFGSDQDDVILAPLTTVQRKLLGITHVHSIEVETAGRAAAFRAEQEIRRLLRERHRLQPGQDDDFRLFNRAELAQASEESARVFTWLLGSIASVSLLVGGIGIMNIMLVSVTERTREIGIRMALGARRRDILWQFMAEALVLSGIGGLAGIVLGLAGAALVARFSSFQASVTGWSVLVAFLFAVLVGVFFGLQPARKAAGLKPIEALRYE
ncbi:MAG: ABC transporter permease [Gammaproteobacteria bacterium]